MKIVIDLDDEETERVTAALSLLWSIHDANDVPRKRADGQEIVDIEKTPRPANEEEVKRFCLKHLQGMVRQYEDKMRLEVGSPFTLAGAKG